MLCASNTLPTSRPPWRDGPRRNISHTLPRIISSQCATIAQYNIAVRGYTTTTFYSGSSRVAILSNGWFIIALPSLADWRRMLLSHAGRFSHEQDAKCYHTAASKTAAHTAHCHVGSKAVNTLKYLGASVTIHRKYSV